MPASFVEVIDCLVDLVLRFEGPYKKAAEEGEQIFWTCSWLIMWRHLAAYDVRTPLQLLWQVRLCKQGAWS